jgi:hypothetical protein
LNTGDLIKSLPAFHPQICLGGDPRNLHARYAEARAIQAVPLSRISSSKEVKIFLNHKSTDNPLAYYYYNALKEAGFDPWLDEPNMAAGANLKRDLLREFEESYAAAFLSLRTSEMRSFRSVLKKESLVTFCVRI